MCRAFTSAARAAGEPIRGNLHARIRYDRPITVASAAASSAVGMLALGLRLVDLEVVASQFSSVESGNGLRCFCIIGISTKANPQALPVFRSVAR